METQTSFFTPDYRQAASRRFPLSGATGNIRGSGQFALVSKCFRRWKVLLYQTAEDRTVKLQEWNERGCCHDCTSDHEVVDLTL